MPATRVKKKARINQGKDAAQTKSPTTISDGISQNSNPQLSSELIARVATYLPLFRSVGVIINGSRRFLYNDVHNLCLATGPFTSRSIKQCFLKKNLHYIEECQELFGWKSADWVREGHLAWMSANKNWRNYVTDDAIEKCKYTPPAPRQSSITSGRRPRYVETKDSTYHALSGLANPARAIQLGLIDALRFLVEDKCINVNTKQWRTYHWSNPPVHLLTVAINNEEPEAFEYLLSLEATDFNNDCTEYDRDHSKSIFSSALEKYVAFEANGQYFRALVKHTMFQPNKRFLDGYNPDRRAPAKMTLLHMFVNEYTNMLMMYGNPAVLDAKEKRFLRAFSLVLDAGADPKLEFDDLSSPFAIATDNLRAASCGGITFGRRLVYTLRKMISMMSKQGRE